MAKTAAVSGYAHITKDREIRGGKACIAGTRIAVMDVVSLQREGYTPEKMLNVFASPLTMAQIHAALAYYYDHEDEIEASFAEEEGVEAEINRDRTEFLNRRTDR